jgi:hypothetical protein
MARGRPSKGADALRHQVNFRLSEADHLTYLKLGGASWFRDQLKACRVRLDATPTAHQPFPRYTDPAPGEPVAALGMLPRRAGGR